MSEANGEYHPLSGSAFPPVLDACCGSRMFWFDKADPRCLYVDKRRETWAIDRGTPGTVGRKPIVVNPDQIADFTALPFPDGTFDHVVFDPPHVERRQGTGIIEQKYGWLDGDWRDMLRKGFAECFRVLRPGGTLIFKWADTDHPLSDVLALTDERPLYGHRSGKKAGTHWVAFLKPNTQISGGTPSADLGVGQAPESSGFDGWGEKRVMTDDDGNEYLVEHDSGVFFNVTRIPPRKAVEK